MNRSISQFLRMAWVLALLASLPLHAVLARLQNPTQLPIMIKPDRSGAIPTLIEPGGAYDFRPHQELKDGIFECWYDLYLAWDGHNLGEGYRLVYSVEFVEGKWEVQLNAWSELGADRVVLHPQQLPEGKIRVWAFGGLKPGLSSRFPDLELDPPGPEETPWLDAAPGASEHPPVDSFAPRSGHPAPFPVQPPPASSSLEPDLGPRFRQSMTPSPVSGSSDATSGFASAGSIALSGPNGHLQPPDSQRPGTPPDSVDEQEDDVRDLDQDPPEPEVAVCRCGECGRVFAFRIRDTLVRCPHPSCGKVVKTPVVPGVQPVPGPGAASAGSVPPAETPSRSGDRRGVKRPLGPNPTEEGRDPKMRSAGPGGQWSASASASSPVPVLPDQDEGSESIDEYLGRMDPNLFLDQRSAIRFLSTAESSKTGRIVVPRSMRWPEPVQRYGSPGYAEHYKRLGLTQRECDTRGGHHHYWFVEDKVKWVSTQAAITTAIKKHEAHLRSQPQETWSGAGASIAGSPFSLPQPAASAAATPLAQENAMLKSLLMNQLLLMNVMMRSGPASDPSALTQVLAGLEGMLSLLGGSLPRTGSAPFLPDLSAPAAPGLPSATAAQAPR